MEPKWWKSADVLIAGYGAAGAAAAVAAHDAGAEALIIEKMKQGGGNTLVSMGGFLCPSDAEDAISYISALYDYSHSEKDEKLIRIFAEEAVKNVPWIKSLKKGTDGPSLWPCRLFAVAGFGGHKQVSCKGEKQGRKRFREKSLGGVDLRGREETANLRLKRDGCKGVGGQQERRSHRLYWRD